MEVNVSRENIHIVDSYLIKSTDEMYKCLMDIRSNYGPEYCHSLNRTNKSMINEWCAHNLLYSLHLFRSHTKDVDLEENNNVFKKVSYWILKIIYKLTYKIL